MKPRPTIAPPPQSSSGNGTLRHDLGRAATLTCSYLTPSGIDMRMDTRSAGASSGSRSRNTQGMPRRGWMTRKPLASQEASTCRHAVSSLHYRMWRPADSSVLTLFAPIAPPNAAPVAARRATNPAPEAATLATLTTPCSRRRPTPSFGAARPAPACCNAGCASATPAPPGCSIFSKSAAWLARPTVPVRARFWYHP